MLHQIKIQEQYYNKIIEGQKTFEVRKNDRDYKINDLIQFVLVANDGTGSIIKVSDKIFKIGFILYGGKFGIDKGYCVFSIKEAAITDIAPLDKELFGTVVVKLTMPDADK